MPEWTRRDRPAYYPVNAAQANLFEMSVDQEEATYLSSLNPRICRERGVTFTPQWIVDFMLGLLGDYDTSDTTIVDAGAGAGRFALAAARRLPRARVLAVEKDVELAASLGKLVRKSGFERRASVLREDFLVASLPVAGRKVFLGNPPYIRHHTLSRAQKSWLAKAGRTLGGGFSELSGLHIYFLARCLMEAREGDRLLMILPTEWLETRYGRDLKSAMLRRASSIDLYVFRPGVEVFDSVMTTSVILDLGFGGSRKGVYASLLDVNTREQDTELRRISLPEDAAERVNWLHLAWSVTGVEPRPAVDVDTIELGELFNIHRGQVTGMNAVWIANPETIPLIPDRYLFPCITDAKEILDCPGNALQSSVGLRSAIDLPCDLDEIPQSERARVQRFLDAARSAGAADTYVARHRKPWWRIGLKQPAAIMMSYMARQAPRFVLNQCSARLLNIAHGLYPRAPMSAAQLRRIVSWLNQAQLGRIGRTYAGGLMKIEPGDAMRIRVPRLNMSQQRLAA